MERRNNFSWDLEPEKMNVADIQLIRCPTCGATNRIPSEKLKQRLQAVCGRCKTPLTTAHEVVTVTDSNFSTEVEHSSIPVLLDLWAPWCGPCRMVAPILQELAKEMAGRIRFAKLNVDENPLTASRFRIQSIPTLLVIEAGREVDRIIGAQPKSAIERWLQRFLA